MEGPNHDEAEIKQQSISADGVEKAVDNFLKGDPDHADLEIIQQVADEKSWLVWIRDIFPQLRPEEYSTAADANPHLVILRLILWKEHRLGQACRIERTPVAGTCAMFWYGLFASSLEAAPSEYGARERILQAYKMSVPAFAELDRLFDPWTGAAKPLATPASDSRPDLDKSYLYLTLNFIEVGHIVANFDMMRDVPEHVEFQQIMRNIVEAAGGAFELFRQALLMLHTQSSRPEPLPVAHTTAETPGTVVEGQKMLEKLLDPDLVDWLKSSPVLQSSHTAILAFLKDGKLVAEDPTPLQGHDALGDENDGISFQDLDEEPDLSDSGSELSHDGLDWITGMPFSDFEHEDGHEAEITAPEQCHTNHEELIFNNDALTAGSMDVEERPDSHSNAIGMDSEPEEEGDDEGEDGESSSSNPRALWGRRQEDNESEEDGDSEAGDNESLDEDDMDLEDMALTTNGRLLVFWARPRRGKVQKSCKGCRDKGCRCDGIYPMCSSCRQSGIACVYTQSVYKARAPTYPDPDDLETILAHLKAVPRHSSVRLKGLPMKKHILRDPVLARQLSAFHNLHENSLLKEVLNDKSILPIEWWAHLKRASMPNASERLDPAAERYLEQSAARIDGWKIKEALKLLELYAEHRGSKNQTARITELYNAAFPKNPRSSYALKFAEGTYRLKGVTVAKLKEYIFRKEVLTLAPPRQVYCPSGPRRGLTLDDIENFSESESKEPDSMILDPFRSTSPSPESVSWAEVLTLAPPRQVYCPSGPRRGLTLDDIENFSESESKEPDSMILDPFRSTSPSPESVSWAEVLTLSLPCLATRPSGPRRSLALDDIENFFESESEELDSMILDPFRWNPPSPKL